MGVEENIQAIRRLESAYAEEDYDTVRSLVAADLMAHTPGAEFGPPGIEGAIAANQGAHSFFPDKAVEISDLFGAGDRTVAHMRMTGTNSGAAVAWAGLKEPTGKAVDVDWIQIARHDDSGRIVETWAQMDTPKLMVQLGAMPAPEGM
jgi:predicted ester cyclase